MVRLLGKLAPAKRRHKAEDSSQRLGDFTTTWNVIPISALATVIGVLSGFVALALLRLIGIFTNLFFFLLGVRH